LLDIKHSNILENVGMFLELMELGRYKHYKGGEYEVIGIAKHSETGEDLVVYKKLSTGEMWARPKKMFLEAVLVDSEDVPRFRKV